ncbi:MAG: type II secretion system major pseudopilin GspG [Deltaproteobacteria bacterium]|nr:type II secretion system major pseudopilin GspG [Deltaproteobacteria bacterium]
MLETAERKQDVQVRNLAGFTLIEIMAVVLIIGLLSTIVGVSIFAQVDKGRITATSVQISNLESVLELYRMDSARYPTTEQGLDALVNEPDDARNYPPGGYLQKRRVPEDPWGNPYEYEQPGQNNPDSYDLWSYGGDGNPGGDGANADIGNWNYGGDEN